MQLPSYDPTSSANAPGDGSLRVSGTAPTISVSGKQDLPSTLSAAAAKQQAAVEIVRDLWGGTERMREQGPKYLPKSPGEEALNYGARLSRAVFFNAFRRTVSGLVGFVFAKDPKLGDDVPPVIKNDHWENIDNAGTHGDVFLREQLQDAIQTGHNAILVEFPATGGTQTPLEEVVTGEVRPYWVPIKKDHIVSWRTTSENGKLVLTQLVVKECTIEADGIFGEKEVTRYRMFYRTPTRLVGFKLLRVVNDKEIVVDAEGTYPTQEEIPVAEVTTSGRRSMFESDPPLLDLAYLNIAHYQERSDYAYSKHMTCVPILGLYGFEQEVDAQGNKQRVIVGPNAALVTSNHEARAEYTTHDGGSLAEVRESLEGLKSEMGTLGIAMLAPQKRAAETAEAKRLDQSTQVSELGVMARGLQDAVEKALEFHARYLRIESGGSIEINRNYDAELMTPDVMQAYVSLARDLGLPLRVILQQLKQGGRISADTDLEELESEMLANVAAQQDAKRLADEARLEQELAIAKSGQGGGSREQPAKAA